MDSEFSPLPPKRMRTSLNGNLNLTQCVRQFKLPRQFPSMVKKMCYDPSKEKNKLGSNLDTAVTCLTKSPIQAKLATNQEIPVAGVVRKIKLKGKDGRDLGEVNVQDLPRNIQGKTITLSKNNVLKPPEIVLPADKSKSVTIGLLTPVNVLKTERLYPANLPSLTCVNGDQRELVDVATEKKRTMVVEQKQMSAVMDQHGRPQVLVFQSGNSWHMVKIATASPPIQNGDGGQNISIGKLTQVQNCGTPTVLRVDEPTGNIGGGDESITSEREKLVNKQCDMSSLTTVYGRWKLRQAQLKSTATGKQKAQPRISSEDKEGESRPTIEVFRIYGSKNAKPVSQIEPTMQRLAVHDGNPPVKEGQATRNKLPLRQDVMVVLPSDIPTTLGGGSAFARVNPDADSPPLRTAHDEHASAKLTKNIERSQSPAEAEAAAAAAAAATVVREFVPTNGVAREPAESGKKGEEISSNLNILTKALSTVEDKELRAKALKALAECGIGMERLVPICPASERRPMKDSDTQTPVFGVIEPEHFVYVTPENPAVKRIRPIERKTPQKIGHIVGNPHPHELLLNTMDNMNWMTSEVCTELSDMVEGFVQGNEEVNVVRDIFTKPKRVAPRLVSQLEQDFQSYKEYDENGLLSIHRAVISDDLKGVTRLLTVLKARNESFDIPTANEETSLELAVRHNVSTKIVKLLLDYGAEPTTTKIGHDSALIIASKKSLPVLKDLIPYVTSRKSLDNYDSSGFAALHYCAQNNNKSGVIELTRASANVNTRDRRSGRTPLFHAVENEHIELAQLLLDKGALPNIASYSGHTVFALIEEGKHFSLVESLTRAGK